jgi:hypothetical protein
LLVFWKGEYGSFAGATSVITTVLQSYYNMDIKNMPLLVMEILSQQFISETLI